MSKTQTESTDKTLALPEQMIELDLIAKDCQLSEQAGDKPFSTALKTADAIIALRTALNDEAMAVIMELMNTPLGFLTDRNGRQNWKGETKPLYEAPEIRDAVIEATLRGFHVIGNEFNIIAGRFYAAKAGLRRLVMKFNGLTDFRDFYEVPRISSDKHGAIVKGRASWRLNGIDDLVEAEFAVKGDQYAGADSYIGKAERKLLNRVYNRLSGIHTPEGDVGEFAETETMPARDPDAPVSTPAPTANQTAPFPEAPPVDAKAKRAEQKAKVAAAASSQANAPADAVEKVANAKVVPTTPEPTPDAVKTPAPEMNRVNDAAENYTTILRAITAAGVSEEEICEQAFQSLTFGERPDGMMIAAAEVGQIASLAKNIEHEIAQAIKRRARKVGV